MRPSRVLMLGLILGMIGCERQPIDAAALAVEKGCVACHGKDGVGISPAFPTLAGQWPRYLRVQLRAYRSGERTNPVMNVQAAALTDAEIRALAAFYGDEP
jgi:cytochrome c553